MRMGRPKVALILTDDERRRLDSLAHRSRSAPALARRARIILACAEGTDSKVVSLGDCTSRRARELAALLQADEAAALSKLARDADATLVLDVRGQSLTSEAFAALIARIRDGGAKTAAFLIGGPDGLSAELLAAARHKVSLGPMTLPHQLVRIVLAEQLYRAATILSGHPYHRG